MEIMTQKIQDELKSLLKKHGVVLAYLFGSMANGKITPLSDIDIAVVFSKQTPKNEYFDRELRIATEVSTLCEIEHADIVNLETAHSPLLKYNAVFHGKLLLSFGEEKRRQFEFGIMQEHEDTEHLREAAYKILINRTIINNHK